MTFLYSAIRLNNEGIQHLISGNETNAFTAFKTALDKISHGDRNSVQDESTPSAPSPFLDTTSSQPPPPRRRRPLSCAPLLYTSTGNIISNNSCNKTLSSTNDISTINSPFFFQQTLFIQEDQWLVPTDAPYLSAVIIYNMGLVFHLKGEAVIDDDEQKQALYYKALFLYNVSLRHIQAATNNDMYSYSDVVVVVLNNTSHIHNNSNDSSHDDDDEDSSLDKGRTVLMELWSVLRHIQQQGSNSKRVTSAFTQSDMDGFVQNVLLLLRGTTSLAPAAA